MNAKQEIKIRKTIDTYIVIDILDKISNKLTDIEDALEDIIMTLNLKNFTKKNPCKRLVFRLNCF